MRKKLCIIITMILTLNIITPIYADEEINDINISDEELNEIIETATSAISVPTINSRNAILFDRTSRHNTIWKR